MNVKSVWNSLTNINVSTQKLDKKTKLEASDEKDTQLGRGDEETTEQKMSEEEANKALEILKNLDGVKENNLSCKLVQANDRFIVLIEDPEGKIVRRIPESELWINLRREQVNISNEVKKGSILNRAG